MVPGSRYTGLRGRTSTLATLPPLLPLPVFLFPPKVPTAETFPVALALGNLPGVIRSIRVIRVIRVLLKSIWLCFDFAPVFP